MRTKTEIKSDFDKIRHEAVKNAKAYHAEIEPEYYETKDIEFILAYCHPLERNDFELRLTKLNYELKKLEEQE